jgi:hypothetical protein
MPAALRRLPYSSDSYAGGLDQDMERSRCWFPSLLVLWTADVAADLTTSSGLVYFTVFTSFLKV